MELSEKIDQEFKEALKSRDSLKVDVLRLLKSAIINREIELKSKLNPDDILDVIRHQIKIRKEAIEQYLKAGRADLKEKEEKEQTILKEYLPAQLTDDAIINEVREIIDSLNAKGPADQGKVMQVLAPKLKSQADLGQVAKIVREQLLSREG